MLFRSAPAGFETFTWLGRGPEESYPDRKAGVAIGLYTGSVDDQHVPYVVPQENGNKTDVRWAALQDAQGRGLMLIGEPLLQVSVSHYTTDDLFRALHTTDLVRRPEIQVNLDLLECGLGGNWCGPATLDRHLVWPGDYRLAVVLRSIDPGAGLPALGRAWICSSE